MDAREQAQDEPSDGQVSELAMEGTDPKEASPEEPAVGEPAKPDADPAQGGTL